jgi:PAS domain-containing protein
MASSVQETSVCRDISQRRHDEETLLAAIVNWATDTIISTTLDGVITTWKEAAARMFGYPNSEMIGQSIRRLIPPPSEQGAGTSRPIGRKRRT